MRKFLSHDEESGELLLVYTDLWNGQHERTEYRVLSARAGGHVLRNLPDLDGKDVQGTAPDLYVRLGPWGERTVPVWTEDRATGPTVKVLCPKATNARSKCSRCA
jgi:hypothetical protein